MIADVEVRLAKAVDAEEIAAMSRDYIEHGLPWGWTYERVARAIKNSETNVAVVGQEGALIGFGIMSYPEEEAHLQLFAVRRAHQRRGVGTTILVWLEAVARIAGAKRIRVECRKDNLVARNFYCVNGYHEHKISEAMYNNSVDGIRLEKWLRSDEPI